MPTTQIEHPILAYFLCVVESRTGMPAQPLNATVDQIVNAKRKNDDGSDIKPKALPKGVVLGPDGKPCRSCTSFGAWAAMTKQDTAKQGTTSISKARSDCPPDVEELGRSTWSFLHTLAANYPERPSLGQQTDVKQFMGLFGKLYPCWVCADDFRAWMKDGNEPRVSSRDDFGRWLCEAHNAVNVKLGKQSFDCNRWEERWRTGWKDGRCD